MKKILVAVLALAAGGTARAWEDATTHAGMTEAAALGSHLHERLRALGFDRGLYEPLTIPPEDAPALIASLRQFPPTEGFVPDARGRQYAIAWLAGGAAIADGPFAANYFFDPATGKGWRAPARGVIEAIGTAIAQVPLVLPDEGVPAPDWVASDKNPLGIHGFVDQYARAVRGATPGERSRAMAGALIAAGAILHGLEDMGSPSRVRGDALAHLDPLSDTMDDLGSRFEHIAALAFGRTGVPGPSRVVTRTTLRAFFTSKDGDGLADVTASRWFSPNTLPGTTRIGTGGRTVTPPLAKPRPVPPARMNLMAASQPQGTTLTDDQGVCLARYRVERGVLSFWLDDDCMLAEIDAILPEVTSYSAGALDYLFRGELDVEESGGHVTAKAHGALGAGQLELFAEDARGVRTPIGARAVPQAADGASLGDAALPDSAKRAIALYTGVDGAGEPLVAVGVVDVK